MLISRRQSRCGSGARSQSQHACRRRCRAGPIKVCRCDRGPAHLAGDGAQERARRLQGAAECHRPFSMSRRPRRNHTPAFFKAKVALAAIKGDRTLTEAGRAIDVHPIRSHRGRRSSRMGQPMCSVRRFLRQVPSCRRLRRTGRSAGNGRFAEAFDVRPASLAVVLGFAWSWPSPRLCS